MSKSLFLVRHAKSDWSNQGQKDYDRELNGRGLGDAPKMGGRLAEMNVMPDLIISSPAVRAKLTAEYIAEQLQYEVDRIQFDEEIYEASTRSLLSVINGLDDKYNKVMIFGHNPTLTYLTEYLTKSPIGNIPTCGAVEIEFEVDSWKEVTGDVGKLKWFIYPKEGQD